MKRGPTTGLMAIPIAASVLIMIRSLVLKRLNIYPRCIIKIRKRYSHGCRDTWEADNTLPEPESASMPQKA